MLEHGDFFVEVWQPEGQPKYTRQWLQQEFVVGRTRELCLFWGHQPAEDGQLTKSCLSQWWMEDFYTCLLYTSWAELYSFMDVQEMTWKRKKLLSLMAKMDNYSDYLLLWSPRDKKLCYLDIEHEEFHPLAKWDDFIADPGRYLNGMIEGEFEE